MYKRQLYYLAKPYKALLGSVAVAVAVAVAFAFAVAVAVADSSLSFVEYNSSQDLFFTPLVYFLAGHYLDP